jgi:hypothetical protein
MKEVSPGFPQRPDPEGKDFARHARERADQWLRHWMRLDGAGRCPV